MPRGKTLNPEQFEELLLQGLETEIGGVQIYATALRCAINEDLRKEWEKYREQPEEHVRVMAGLIEGIPGAAQLVAAECVVLAETKDHPNWELIGFALEHPTAEQREAIKAAHDEVEDNEDEHLYHTKGWSRELWLESLGIPAVLPPPEEEKDVKTAIGAARAKMARKEML